MLCADHDLSCRIEAFELLYIQHSPSIPYSTIIRRLKTQTRPFNLLQPFPQSTCTQQTTLLTFTLSTFQSTFYSHSSERVVRICRLQLRGRSYYNKSPVARKWYQILSYFVQKKEAIQIKFVKIKRRDSRMSDQQISSLTMTPSGDNVSEVILFYYHSLSLYEGTRY